MHPGKLDNHAGWTLVDKPIIQKIEGGQKLVGLSIVTMHRWPDTNNDEEQLS